MHKHLVLKRRQVSSCLCNLCVSIATVFGHLANNISKINFKKNSSHVMNGFRWNLDSEITIDDVGSEKAGRGSSPIAEII